jgi:XTP/dITP diphosphohydrolase
VTEPPAVVLATRNDHKVREVTRLFGGRVAVEPLPDGAESPEETGTTFAENALIKARAAVAATGRAAIADDSGVEAEAIDWAPGVYSARFAGPGATDAENLAKLRRAAPAGSRLRYVCVVAHVDPDGTETLFEGVCEGTMSAEERGERGFGYDPVFIPAGDAQGRTMAELTDDEKDAISHRGRACRRLLAWLTAD